MAVNWTEEQRRFVEHAYERGYADGLRDALKSLKNPEQAEREKQDFAYQGSLQERSGCGER